MKDEGIYLLASCIEGGILYQALYHREELEPPVEDLPEGMEAMLAEGDIFAWWCLEVRANYKGFHRSVYLGGMSGNSEAYINDAFNSLKREAKKYLLRFLKDAYEAYVELNTQESYNYLHRAD